MKNDIVDFEKARANFGEELFSEVIDLFFVHGPELLAGVCSAVHEGDAKAIEQTAHRLKGLGKNMYAQPLVDAAYRVESMGRDSDLEGICAALDELRNRYAELETFLKDSR